MKSLFSVLALGALLLAPLSGIAAERSVFNTGDLIKSPTNSAVYYFASNGKRYVFPNDKTYFTWYNDFSQVKVIPAKALSAIPIGGNVTYRPGRKMIKITTDPRVYAVDQGGVLRHVMTESIAQSLYSLSWKQQIDDVPDQLFTNYRLGTPIESTREFSPQNVMTQTTTIAMDKQLTPEIANISIGDTETGFVPTTITIKRGTTVTWTNRDIYNHSVKGAGWQSGTLAPNGTYARTFSTTGSFDYTDTFNSGANATINVVP
ncbi:hypothetical protein KBD13_00495 [Patescibacteria group bacterium]|jgi:plastocyanin|nr:hypothetical protein [Patescibacteria group bacterium]MDQ5919393.1 Cupredoxin 1 protein [Patescibacteria group bacterium]